MKTLVSRRKFITGALAFITAEMAAGCKMAEAVLIKSKSLISHFNSPLLLETPLAELGKSWITPNNIFFVLSRADIRPSQAERESWQIEIGGDTDRALKISLRDLRQKFELVEFSAYLQCAGNGRKFFKPEIEGLSWGYGAIGNARWSGVRLAEVLRAAGIKSTAKHVAFVGRDALPDRPDSYIKSIPLKKALDPRTILAITMNDEPLPDIHGGPARLLVPGWGGTYSVKWLTHIIALRKPWDGFWMNRAYRVNDKSFAEFSVNSVITAPSDGAACAAGPVEISGLAWTGEAEVVSVEVSADGGRSWQRAKLGDEQAKYAWRRWSLVWAAKPGDYTIMARAADNRGKIQPLTQDNWNPGGYGWNAVHAIRVSVT